MSEVNSWAEWYFVRGLLRELASKECVQYEEIEMCFREQFGVADGAG